MAAAGGARAEATRIEAMRCKWRPGGSGGECDWNRGKTGPRGCMWAIRRNAPFEGDSGNGSCLFLGCREGRGEGGRNLEVRRTGGGADGREL